MSLADLFKPPVVLPTVLVRRVNLLGEESPEEAAQRQRVESLIKARASGRKRGPKPASVLDAAKKRRRDKQAIYPRRWYERHLARAREAARERMRLQREADKAEANARQREYYALNRERMLQRSRDRYHAMTPEQKKARNKAMYQRSVERKRARESA